VTKILKKVRRNTQIRARPCPSFLVNGQSALRLVAAAAVNRFRLIRRDFSDRPRFKIKITTLILRVFHLRVARIYIYSVYFDPSKS